MIKEHLNLLSPATGGFIFRRSDLRAGDLARILVDIAWNLLRHRIGRRASRILQLLFREPHKK
jgi:hypothetical protein